jgi:hypothetical protein
VFSSLSIEKGDVNYQLKGTKSIDPIYLWRASYQNNRPSMRGARKLRHTQGEQAMLILGKRVPPGRDKLCERIEGDCTLLLSHEGTATATEEEIEKAILVSRIASLRN